MRLARVYAAIVGTLWLCVFPARGQDSVRLERLLGIPARQKPAPPLPQPEGLADHVVDGKLTLSLDDAIRLALANNTDIKLNHTQIESANNGVHRSYQPFDPLLTSSFNDQRAKSPAFTQLSGAAVTDTLSQTTQFNYQETFLTGTNFQSSFNAFKQSTNSSFVFINPSISTFLQFTVTQPLLRNRGLFPNRAPILIAQKNLKQAQASFQAEVNDTVLQAIGQYWNVILARENLGVQKKSLDEAQKSYDHDKKALSLGALPPLDIYRSESQVASRRVGVIQAEYALKQAEDQLRHVVGADLDERIRALDIQLTENPEPGTDLLNIDIATALSHALANRPEFEALRQQISSDEMNVRLAHNNLQPNLQLSGFYAGNGLGGDEFNTAVPPQLIAAGGLGTSLDQLFHFNSPTYGASLNLTLPIKNHAAEASLGDALVSRKRDQYQERQTKQNITLETTNAVHMLEVSKLSIEAAKVALDLAEKNLHAEERKYELGVDTIFFVLEAQTELAQAEQSLVQAQINYQLSVAAVDHATGDLLDHHHVQITDHVN
ncbi:MAG TPA: TolC family protein [Candidatus Methylomirabilis sp.]|nr:TolC family protein [Candidatus Methylomirabilis sp.]